MCLESRDDDRKNDPKYLNLFGKPIEKKSGQTTKKKKKREKQAVETNEEDLEESQNEDLPSKSTKESQNSEKREKKKERFEKMKKERQTARALSGGPTFNLPRGGVSGYFTGPVYGFNELWRCEEFSETKIEAETYGKFRFKGLIYIGNYMVRFEGSLVDFFVKFS